MVQCKTCNKQYIGSTNDFRSRFNNYKTCYNKYSVGKTVPQMSFHSHFGQSNHNGIDDWSFTLIDQARDENQLRKKESFWQEKLETFIPKGLNTKEVTYDYG